jgi:hypothetical protein
LAISTTFCSPARDLPLLNPLKGAILASKPLGIWRMSVTMPEIGLFEAIYSARSIRRLKPDPVPEELITAVLDAAIRAPSGGHF